MTDIVEFLTARLDEDDQLARAVQHAVGTQYAALTAAMGTTYGLSMVSLYWRSRNPARVLAEVEAKRALMALHGLEALSHQPAQYELPDGFAGEFVGYCQPCSDIDYPEGLATYYEPWPCPSMRILASVYVEHPDYEQEWQVG